MPSAANKSAAENGPARITRKCLAAVLTAGIVGYFGLHAALLLKVQPKWAVPELDPLPDWTSPIGLGSGSSTSQQQDQKQDQPKKPLNVLLLYPDDMRHNSMSCAGSPVVQTPFLDRLATEGIRFTHNFATTSICWISRATMITGQYNSRHQSMLPQTPYFYDTWNQTAWPYLLRQAGYYVGHIGKWQFWDFRRVFKEYDWARMHEGRHWYPTRHTQHYFRMKNKETNIHATDRAVYDVFDFLESRPKDKPFALTVAFYPPKAVGQSKFDQYNPKNSTLQKYYHENITIPEPPVEPNMSWAKLPRFFGERDEARRRWKERFLTPEMYQHNMKDYYALITEVDEGCRQIYEELERQGILDETLIMFSADNGYFLGEHGMGGKWYPFRDGIGVPLIIRDPRMPRDKVGTLEDSFTLNIDLAETILGAAGLPPAPMMQGRNIADLYLQPSSAEPWRDEFFYEFEIPDHKLISNSTALIRHDFKYIKWSRYKIEQLFDLKKDPLEIDDVAAQPEYAEILAEMRQRHNELKERIQQG